MSDGLSPVGVVAIGLASLVLGVGFRGIADLIFSRLGRKFEVDDDTRTRSIRLEERAAVITNDAGSTRALTELAVRVTELASQVAGNVTEMTREIAKVGQHVAAMDARLTETLRTMERRIDRIDGDYVNHRELATTLAADQARRGR